MMTTPEASLAGRASAWRDADPDPRTRAELDQLLADGDTAALAERFDGSLAFGTAGIRTVRSRAGLAAARASATEQAGRMLAAPLAELDRSMGGDQP